MRDCERVMVSYDCAYLHSCQMVGAYHLTRHLLLFRWLWDRFIQISDWMGERIVINVVRATIN